MLSPRRLMLTLAVALTVAIAAAAAAPPASAQGRSVDYSEFYEALEPFGRWFEHPRWGLVWWPYVQQDEDWRPYTRGQWVYTDDHGWYWDSEEEWGWATYHYGRWVLEARYGWLWVPGDVWAPAWVAWRESDEYIGWAPLAPDAIWDPGYGVRYSYWEYDTPYWAPIWCFVHPRYVLAPRVWYRFSPRSRNAYLLGRTRHVTQYAVVSGRIHNRSIDVRRIARITRRDVPVVRVRSFDSKREFARGRKKDGAFVGIYRPQFKAAKQDSPRFAPRLTQPDKIENARRTRTTLRNFGPDDEPKRDRSEGPAPSFKDRKDGSPSLRSLPPGAPPSVADPAKKGPPGDDSRRTRGRSVDSPTSASIPTPQPSKSDDTSQSSRKRTFDKSPSAKLVPSSPPGSTPRSSRERTRDKSPSAKFVPLPPSGDAGRSSRSRSRNTSGGPPPSGSVNRRLTEPRTVQPRTISPPRATQSPSQYQLRTPPPQQVQSQAGQSSGSQRGDRKRGRKDEDNLRR